VNVALQQLLEEMLTKAPDAQWGRARLAGLQLQLRQYQPAVTNYQAAIRCVGHLRQGLHSLSRVSGEIPMCQL
jgi:hypothetical protein